MNAHSVVVLDNASIHNADDIADLIKSTGTLVIFLPPYSPDLNAIKEAFSLWIAIKSLVCRSNDCAHARELT